MICIFSSSSFRPLLFSLNFSLSRSLSLSLWVERSVVFHAGLLVACWDMFGIPESQSKCLTHAGPQRKHTHTHTCMHSCPYQPSIRLCEEKICTLKQAHTYRLNIKQSKVICPHEWPLKHTSHESPSVTREPSRCQIGNVFHVY